MIVLNQNTAHNLMTGGLSAGGTGGFILWLQQNYNLASLGIVAFVALVGDSGRVIDFHFKRLENQRKQEAHDKLMALEDEPENNGEATRVEGIDHGR